MSVDRLLGQYIALLDQGTAPDPGVDQGDGGDLGSTEVRGLGCFASLQLPPGHGMPVWASYRAIDYRGRVVTNSDQYVALVQLQGAVVEGICDTGGARSMLDVATAKGIGLEVMMASDRAEFGTYYGPGAQERPYTGLVKGPVALHFSGEVVLHIPELRIITHSEPLLLLGADVLCGGRSGWNFRSIGVGSDGVGQLQSTRGIVTRSIALLGAPSARRTRWEGVPPRNDSPPRPVPVLAAMEVDDASTT